MDQIFPYANIIVGLLVIIVAFIFHWIGQLISIINWDAAVRFGLQEKGMLPEHKVYEHAIAKADVAVGWLYGIAGMGLILDYPWGYKLVWFPGAVLVYHAFSFWFWTGNQRRAGVRLTGDALRVCWILANTITGILALLVGWNAR